MRSLRFACLLLAGCVGGPNKIEIELSPSVISSLDGTTAIDAIVAADTTPLAGETVHATITYKDRNGVAHDIAPVDGKTDARGVFHATIQGLIWDGTGTVTVETSPSVTSAATFAVLDRTPPKITILPPTTDLRVGPGLPLDVRVQVSDEIGVSEVTVDGVGTISGARSTVVADGTQMTTLTFRMAVGQNAQIGPSIVLHALASDLSGNLATADGVTLTVDPAISIATPPGLGGSVLVDGTAQQLVNPRGIAVSAHDGHLYVADQAGVGACNPSCIWRIDAATGAIDPTPVVVGTGSIEGVTFDATGDNLYFSDRQNHTGRLTWNGSAYTGAVACSSAQAQMPQDPYHLVIDATLGMLVVDGNSKDVVRVATCAAATVGTAFTSNANFDQPRGIASGPAGELYVSDTGRDRVSKIAGGQITPFESGLTQPYGMRWTPGTTAWANSLMIAASGDRIVAASTGTGSLAAAYLRTSPIDLAFAGGTMYVLTSPGATLHGRIYQVTGF